MEYSILYPDGCVRPEPLNEDTLYHLSLDRSFRVICSDTVMRRYFLDVLKRPLNDEGSIGYRRQILSDFIDNPGLLEKLTELYKSFAEVERMPELAKKGNFSVNRSNSATVGSAKSLLGLNALCLKRALQYINGFTGLLSSSHLRSRGLLDLLDGYRASTLDGPSARLIGICTELEELLAGDRVDLQILLNEDGYIQTSRLVREKYIHIADPEQHRGLFHRSEAKNEKCVPLLRDPSDSYEKLTIFALTELSAALSSLCDQLFDRFACVGEELTFYNVAMMYIDALGNREVTPVFPRMTGLDGDISVKGLCDLYLLLSFNPSSGVVPNDLVISEKEHGLLLSGENGSGKTVYLRSAATVQLLAQAGLPVPAKEATLPVFSNIVTLFSESEKGLSPDSEGGRFEQEVSSVAAAIDNLKEGSLVIINEIFQSTAYAEGALGLYDLLQYLSDCRIKWILVTHLRQLEERLGEDDAAFFHTGAGFHIQPGRR